MSRYNLTGTGITLTGAGNIFNNDPGLGPLQNNGGFVLPDGSTILPHLPDASNPVVVFLT